MWLGSFELWDAGLLTIMAAVAGVVNGRRATLLAVRRRGLVLGIHDG